jgi:hypothetical protein
MCSTDAVAALKNIARVVKVLNQEKYVRIAA